MIGLDSNVLIRHIVQDDPIQSARASDLLERVLSAGNPGFVSIVTMVETMWVLERVYELEPLELAAVIEALLETESLLVENQHEVFLGMIALKKGEGAFADAVIAALGVRAGCRHTLTFDKKALRISGFAAA